MRSGRRSLRTITIGGAALAAAASFSARPAMGATSCFNVSCATTCTPSAPAAIATLIEAADFPAGATTPIAFVDPLDGRGRRLVATQQGAILVWDGSTDEMLPTMFLDLRSGPGGPGAVRRRARAAGAWRSTPTTRPPGASTCSTPPQRPGTSWSPATTLGRQPGRRRPGLGHPDPGHRAFRGGQPQRRPARVRAQRWLPLHLDRRRRRRLRRQPGHERRRPEHQHPARQAAAHRRAWGRSARRPRPTTAASAPATTPCPRPTRSSARSRPATRSGTWACATRSASLSTAHRRHLHRRRRAGPVGGAQRPAGRDRGAR